ncbi:MAG: ATP-binding protein [Verrucomicrobiales bacterium]|nr:ATP-binding protein [Verrucomicrobiales bacterium]
MFDTDAELQERLPLGEDSFLEFKEARFQGDRLLLDLSEVAQTACGMAHRQGGSILLGVAKDGEVIGVDRNRMDELQQRVVGALREIPRPAPPFSVRRRMLQNPAGQQVPILEIVVLQSTGIHEIEGRLFDRVGSVTRAMSMDEVARKLQERGRKLAVEEQPVDRATLLDLDLARVRQFLIEHAKLPSQDLPATTSAAALARDERFLAILRSRGFLQRDLPTIFAVLCFGHTPQQFLPNFTVDCLHYAGNAISGDFLARTTCDGTLDRQIDSAMQFLRERVSVVSRRDTEGREDVPRVDLFAAREAITNAVAHRDYTIEGSPILVRLYGDRLEVSSPGAPPNSLRIEDFGYGARPVRRNQLMVDYLRHVRSPLTNKSYMEAEGGGLGTIRDRCLRHAGREPKFELIGLELRVTLPSL